MSELIKLRLAAYIGFIDKFILRRSAQFFNITYTHVCDRTFAAFSSLIHSVYLLMESQ